MTKSFETILSDIKSCQVCADQLSHGPNPVVSVSEQSQILIIGQAPGTKVHHSGIPWDDASGKNLRKWLGVTDEQFYDPQIFGIVPMGFCYPGKGKSGDLPPRPECAPLWHHQLFDHLKSVKLILLIGLYAQQYYLGDKRKKTLTETVENYKAYLPKYMPLVHPSPRNGIWMRKNPWFTAEIVPALQNIVHQTIASK
ncbi:uracil-DNA glycosylase family protein [Roseivirga misakiensis]|uniref:IclR family transcriptional regulator n=1 Tax=Roseivirga misakiensis TaxID=1563681 RepID=A0A1E5SYU4_9BACT|nr:uracil-DNA glycosylase family protein [Roseivirga misakiensis]OEK04303.1 IclR family transcriptional regulator [Roseivirga misakiensis]